jgi:hypothetical protein
VNRQRTKDNEQMGREANALLEIEQERAKRRQAEQAKQNQPQAKKTSSEKSLNVKPVTHSEKKTRTPPSRDAVGKKVGVSGLTAERSAFCVRMMDALDRIGKTVEAHQSRQLLRKNVADLFDYLCTEVYVHVDYGAPGARF